MFRLILQTEFRLLLRDRAVVTLSVLFAALVVFAVIRGKDWMVAQRETSTRIIEEEGKKLSFLQTEIARVESRGTPSPNGPDPRDPHWVGQVGHRIALPPLPTVPLAIGQAEIFPHEAAISTGVTAASLWDRIEIANPLLTRFGRFDLAFVMVALLPLFLLAVSYNLLSSDREQGTLALAMAQPVSMAQLAWLRLIARGGIVLAFVFVISLASLAYAGVFSYDGAMLRVVLWSALIAAYSTLWLALALLVNTLRTSSAVNALILAGAWAIAVLLLPALLNLLLVTLHPPPSRVALTAALRTATREVNADPEKVLAEFYHAHPELRPAGRTADQGNYAANYFATRQKAEKEIEPLLEEFARQLDSQHGLTSWARFLSPSVLLSDSLTDLAGTGGIRHRRFREQVAAALREWHAWFIPRVIRSEQLKSADHTALPRPQFVEEPVESVARRTMWSLAGLLVPALALASISAVRLRRAINPR